MATSKAWPLRATPDWATRVSPKAPSLAAISGKWPRTAAAEKLGAVARRTARQRGVRPAAVKMEGTLPPHTPSMTP